MKYPLSSVRTRTVYIRSEIREDMRYKFSYTVPVFSCIVLLLHNLYQKYVESPSMYMHYKMLQVFA